MLVNEMVFIDVSVLQEIIDFCCSQEFMTLVERVMSNKLLRQKIRRVLIELVKYQMIIKHLDADVQMNEHYNRITTSLRKCVVTEFMDKNIIQLVISQFK